jgi:hypothetical protein
MVEMKCPEHGLERFKIKIVRRFNINNDEIVPRLRRKTAKSELSLLYVGRNVTYAEAQSYLVDYFRDREMLQQVVRMKRLL